MKKLIVFSVCFLALVLTGADLKIDASVQIVFDQAGAIESERTAVKELTDYLGKILGTELQVAPDGKGRKIVVGYHRDAVSFFPTAELKKLGEEDFLIRSDSAGNIYIIGGRPRGTLYGVYHFLDNLLGVHWYTPEFEFVPKKTVISLPELNIHEKPAFAWRKRASSFYAYRVNFSVADPAWTARNRLNDNGSVPHRKGAKILVEYGGGVYYASPYPCHTMPLFFPPKTYFKEHPEWFAVKKGQRVTNTANSQFVGYCLSNPELRAATIAKVKENFRKCPGTKYISVSEGDGSGTCECPECAALIARHGGKDSALWLNFINQIADAVRDEFPGRLVGTLAYTHTAEPPENMTARDNVLIWLCVWGKWRGLPYDDPHNDTGCEFINKTLKGWTAICKNVHIWDYISTYANQWLPMPDLRSNIANFKTFRDLGVTGVYPQGLRRHEAGEPIKYWLCARAAWNPDGMDYDALLKTFCSEYYGVEAGRFINEYWQNLEQVNRQTGFYKINQAGWIGNAPHASRENMLKSDALFQKALAVTTNPVYRKHILLAYVPVQFVILQNWRDWRKLGEMPDALDKYYAAMEKTAEDYDLVFAENGQPMKEVMPRLRKIASLDFDATASNLYGSIAYDAFDGDLKSRTSFGGYSGWLQAEFPTPREIKRIVTVFSRYNANIEYDIKGSLDGKTWFELVPRQPKVLSGDRKAFFYDDCPVKNKQVKFIRTQIYSAKDSDGKAQWTGIVEQFFDPIADVSVLLAPPLSPVSAALGKEVCDSSLNLPFAADFSRAQSGLNIQGKHDKNGMTSEGNPYPFARLLLPDLKVPLKITITLQCEDGAEFGLIHAPGKNQMHLTWNKLNPTTPEVHSWIVPAERVNKRTWLYFYNVSKKGKVIVSALVVNVASTDI